MLRQPTVIHEVIASLLRIAHVRTKYVSEFHWVDYMFDPAPYTSTIWVFPVPAEDNTMLH